MYFLTLLDCAVSQECASIMGDISLVLDVDNLDNSTLSKFYDTISISGLGVSSIHTPTNRRELSLSLV